MGKDTDPGLCLTMTQRYTPLREEVISQKLLSAKVAIIAQVVI
jgi:hypothetical protein